MTLRLWNQSLRRSDKINSCIRYFALETCPSLSWLAEHGVTGPTADAVVAELNKTGLPLIQIPVVLGNMGPTGLAQLLASMDREAAHSDTKQVNVVINVPREQHKFTLTAKTGRSLFDEVRDDTSGELGAYIECACGGVMACSTCHVILDDKLFAVVGPPCEAEQDMLDLAFGITDTSRLGCQLTISEEFEGTTISIPEGVNNLF
mmetsp:Transcript_29835/g.60990  ORF Transcript_29835/g.60990 Transcript_29835/m.60990 type:complete len:205 (+) Transcript_29835:91-705(+)